MIDLDSIPRRSRRWSAGSWTMRLCWFTRFRERCGANPVGTRVWELIDGQRTLGAISRVIASEFAADLARVEMNVSAFCEDLAQRGVISFDR